MSFVLNRFQVVIWIPGLSSNLDPITDGHVDGIACFVRPGVVLLGGPHRPIKRTKSKLKRQYIREMAANRTALESSVDAKGRKLQVVDLPDSEGALHTQLASKCQHGFCNSYVNFYLTNNGGLVAPMFGVQEDDERARSILQSVFPDRRIVMVDISPIACGGGGIHCITQQQPRASVGTIV